MARQEIQSFVARFTNLLKNQDPELGQILSWNTPSAPRLQSAMDRIRDREGLHVPDSIKSTQGIPESWIDILSHFLATLLAIHDADWVNASINQNNLATSLYQVSLKCNKWILPILYTVSSDLIHLSVKADSVLVLKEQKACRLEEAARTLNRAYTLCATDRVNESSVSRKWGTYYIVNSLFKTYFILKSTNLCATVIRSLGSADLPPLDQYPIAHQVTYKYYLGVLNFQNEKYRAAMEDLMFGLTFCAVSPEACHRPRMNKLLILNYLIPTQLSRGVLPNPKLLHKYPFIGQVYGDLCWSVKTGNVQLFDKALIKNEALLIRLGTWLNVERARGFVLRSLFKKVYPKFKNRWLIHDKTSRLPMAAFKKALQVASGSTLDFPIEIEMDQIECFLAIMIDRGYMKGYLSHEKLMVVLSNKDPFPRLSSLDL